LFASEKGKKGNKEKERKKKEGIKNEGER